ncbi:outer membrane efflux protein [Thioalkalivibrio nitratireducens DSM 14787]|uniref:Outer membrane efflux protein n=1 Tax=Thioalkalivibrio nitratireducens (strain DSM 14787 / UNIQEM 213 / ALEN2) TaxID=1255043 RepID=L0DT61_THIND|nr:TolC family protein [Thioalkalivibrio nitratireducens]AGA32182.1 outer membrane efflux protein [Thioalkalivibrio nitratireducens DSM 14787]
MPIRDLLRPALAGALVAFSAIATAGAGEPDPLPQPLRLEAALAAIDAEHPTLLRARALRDRAEQALEGERSRGDLKIDAHLEARWIDPNDHAPDDGRDDSRALVTARKLLSDFGQTRGRVAAGEREVDARVAHEAIAHARHRLRVMERYFDVLLADLAFARDTEAMASAFVTLERARDRNELGQVSDIDLFELESEYQTARGQRLRALQAQRRTRAALAETLNRPGQAPAQVLGPMLPLVLPELPDLDSLLAAVDTQSPELVARRTEIEAARHRANAARAMNRPRLSAEVQAGAWAREFGGDRNPVAASLILEIPLYQGRERSAALGQATAERHLAEADLAHAMIEARDATRDLFYEIEALLVQREEALARMDYRELYIDRARALYDMEETADLGDSMVQQSAAAHFNAATEYALALAFERLSLLLGDRSLSPFPPDS